MYHVLIVFEREHTFFAMLTKQMSLETLLPGDVAALESLQ